MSETTEYEIGVQAYCQDGECGELARVVIDPIKRAITHLVVEPLYSRELGRLVPVNLVETATKKELHLSCTREKFDALEEAEETNFISAPSGQFGYGQNQMLLMPFFGLGMGGLGMGGLGMGGLGMGGLGMGGLGMGGLGMGGLALVSTNLS